MTPSDLIAIGSIGGGLGAWLRMVIRDECVVRGVASWQAIIGVNLLGCALAGAISTHLSNPAWSAFLVAGVLGGFTTFSSACVDVVAQLKERSRSSALWVMSTIVGAPICAWLGPAMLGASGASSTAALSMTSPANGRFPLNRGRISHHGGGLLAISLGAAVGSAGRIGSNVAASAWGLQQWHATAIANVLGALFAGFVVRRLIAIEADGTPWVAAHRRLFIERLLVFGFAGGLTSFSTLAMEVTTAAQTSWPEAILISSVNLGLGIPATMLGWRIAVARRGEQSHA